MNRYFLVIRRCTLPSIFTAKENFYDSLQEPDDFIPQNGLQRVQKLFMPDKYGESHRDCVSSIYLSSFAFVIGYMIGGIQTSLKSYDNFVAVNQTTRFISAYERKLQDTIALHFLTGGLKWAVKLGGFTAIYSFTAAIIAAFRDKDGIIEYSIGGFLAGGVVRFHMGPKAMFVAAALGSVFCSCIGIISVVSSKLVDVSVKDVRQVFYDFHESRNRAVRNVMTAVRRSDDSQLLKAYEANLQKSNTLGYKEMNEDSVFVISNEKSNSKPVPKSSDKILLTELPDIVDNSTKVKN